MDNNGLEYEFKSNSPEAICSRIKRHFKILAGIADIHIRDFTATYPDLYYDFLGVVIRPNAFVAIIVPIASLFATKIYDVF